MKTAIILGATGVTGGVLLQKLLTDSRYDIIKVFSRNSVGFSHPKIQEYLIDMLQLENYKDNFMGDHVFCCIGTTNTKTPDKDLYRKIDYGIPVTAAKLCKENNISTFIVISALGANTKSTIFYNRIKGEMEESVLAIGILKTHIMQPSLIGGKREEKRFGEYFFKQVMKIINPFLIGCLKKYRSILPETITAAMIYIANADFEKTRILSDEIKEIAKENNF